MATALLLIAAVLPLASTSALKLGSPRCCQFPRHFVLGFGACRRRESLLCAVVIRLVAFGAERHVTPASIAGIVSEDLPGADTRKSAFTQ